ncbi:glycosyltransferase [Zunongwangia sp. F260]|uniref:Glycosyltransferase n=1 Tax=Autumnicola lenta TaxID=3075593 RepID=A0ABU3CIW4_9FLAO|nr:glycosyltransferase [Zunongwangia sp. F260]MDT0646298.1 glycosyltransferase [Zunongwangia sp. F260]
MKTANKTRSRQKSLSGHEDTVAIASKKELQKILMITSFPPRECGIATYSQDLIKALKNHFGNSFKIQICALESKFEKHDYGEEVKLVLDTDDMDSYHFALSRIAADTTIKLVVIQHEFGFFKNTEKEFLLFLQSLKIPVVICFHTVLPNPGEDLKAHVKQIAQNAEFLTVMTKNSSRILQEEYGIAKNHIKRIPHGTHLVKHTGRDILKEKYHFEGRQILSTFGLLGPGKSIETTLDALPSIIQEFPDVLFLIIGKTHPSLQKQEGETYREMLKQKVETLHLNEHVKFIDRFVELPVLLEYLQLSDIYLFTSRDPNQAVSGTFSYALSCGCPIISTPIPHAIEVLGNDKGIIVDFRSPTQLGQAVRKLLRDNNLRKNLSFNALHATAHTAWQNAAIAHGILFNKAVSNQLELKFKKPEVNLDHIKNLTTDFGIIQFAVIYLPDISSGYTLDDNARALIAMCRYYESSGKKDALKYIKIYFNFIKYCYQPDASFLNYVDADKNFTEQNSTVNLEDSTGRAIWALGYFYHMADLLPEELQQEAKEAERIIEETAQRISEIHSTRAMAFIIKGLYYYNQKKRSAVHLALIDKFADRMLQMFRHETDEVWRWYESYLTYGNSVLSEAMLCAALATGNETFKEVAKTSFDFLLSKIFQNDRICVISNQNWLHKGDDVKEVSTGGEQPIDVSYTILAMEKFAKVFQNDGYDLKKKHAFNWFLGNNHLHRIIYNPCTGGCYDGLEATYVNLNQGAESSVSYLLARLSFPAVSSEATAKTEKALLKKED